MWFLKEAVMTNSASIRIAQISDIHIGGSADPVQDIDVRENFLTALAAVRDKNMDLLVLSGDLAAEEGEPGAYAWVSEVMKDFAFPWVVMGGNHDNVATMARYFDIASDLHEGMLYFHREIRGRHLFFLDSSSNSVHSKQLDWLYKEVSAVKNEVLLFMHHPPALCGCAFMDSRHPLRNIEEVRNVLRALPNIHNVFVGHYHTEKLVIQDFKNIHLTPSTMMQIDTHTPGFRMEHVRPGWRLIEWGIDRMDTEVHYALETPRNASQTHIF